MDTKKMILSEVKKHKGEIGLYCLELVRLIGFKDDDDDYYYHVQSLRMKGDLMWYSCVGRIIWLKEYLPKKNYAEIDRVFKLNCREFTNVEKLVNGMCDPKEANN